MKFLDITNVFLTMILFPSTLGAHFRFTNLKCKSLDPEFAEVKECILKMVRRNVVGMNFHLAIKYSQPIDNVEFNLSIFRKSNMYRLFLVNHTIDFCYYMRRPQQYPIFYMFHDSLMAATNANHSCPYTEKDIYVKKMTFNDKTLKDLLSFLPDGEYKLVVTVGAFGIWRLQVNVFGVRD
ncbi:uncharacterized protein LOC117142026 [Drosophila mauritiana]|uniref:Uncharacterized protein LOC117142026 n=1 Tax=Drosophila mauritiana TaxID=7226 RepID=A0A6P8KER6_DROMA|nr:uncharacterized protein LOC117142026 [Drosophila mauritiana]